MGKFVGILAAIVLVATVATGWVTPASPSVARAAATAPPSPAATVPIGWHVFFNGTGSPRHLAVDAARDRVLFTAYIASSSDTRFFVTDSNGTMKGNVSIGPWVSNYGAQIEVDPTTGYAYLSADVGGVVKVDPSVPRILARWTYGPFQPRALSIRAGILYAIQDSNRGGPWPIAKIDAATGAYLGNVTAVPVGPAGDLLVDPAGRYVFVRNATLLRVNLTDGSISDFSYFASFTLSADGRRVYECANFGFFTDFGWYSLDTDTANFVIDGCTPSSMAANPVTDAVALGSRRIANETGWVGGIDTLDPFPSLIDVGWSADGRSLLGILERTANATFEVGAWSGAPRLVQPRAPPLLTPQPICVNFDSVTGLNWTSLTTEIDGQVVPHDPWTPNARGICVDASAIPDGNHTLRAKAWDMVGQRMDDTFPFETDGTPPSVALTSPSLTATLPYNMTGTVNDSHPNIVDVNGNLASVSGATWFSVVSQMHIGGNAIPVTATDTLDNVRSTNFPIRYWPAHTNNVTNTTEHFFVFSPPGWTTSSQALGGGLYATNLIGPTESPLPPLVSIVATRDVNASQGSSYALAAAQSAASYTASIGGVILTPVHALTVGGHPAAAYGARVTLGGVLERYNQTIVLAGEWSRLYIITAAIPDATWPNHPEDLDWILAGFRIETAPPPPPPTSGIPIWAIGVAAAGGAAAAIGAAIWILRRRNTARKNLPEDGTDRQTRPTRPGDPPPER